MLRQLEYSVTFPTTGRTLSETVLFQGGFGAIVGPNESGKSMIIEMIRYCLFGSAALRGKAEDYKNLKASLSFAVKGSEYFVERSAGKAKLTKNGEIIAIGVSPVNMKVPSELGFGLPVFDMSCVANQDELLALGQMKPTERRRAVDSVIGVAALDDLGKWAGDEAANNKRTADELAATVREPTIPVEPDGYQPSAELRVQKEKLDEVRSEADKLRGWLAIEREAPARPVDPTGMDSKAIQELLDQQNDRKIQRQVLEAELSRIPVAEGVTEDELATDEANENLNALYQARRKFLTYHPRPEFTTDELDIERALWQDFKAWQRRQHLAKTIEDLRKKGSHTCPSCTHSWPFENSAIEKLEAEYEAAPAGSEVPATMAEADIERHQRVIDGWDATEWEKHETSPTAPIDVKWTVQERARHRQALESKARRDELVLEIANLKPAEKEPDYATMLRNQQQYEAQMGVWTDKVSEFQAWETEKQAKLVQLTMLDFDLQQLPELNQALDRARIFEQARAVYDLQLEQYNLVATQVFNYRADAEDWLKVKEGLKILRAKIKQHLVPSLNRVASNLITHMTGGSRQNITVDEDFNITVDSQAIDTLSGSGKAVANLALRIGLGQVLTNNVFSAFMGDEIDASMDKDRAEKTSGVLHTLKGRISQLLLVSHKYPAADYYIAVGENSDQDLLVN